MIEVEAKFVVRDLTNDIILDQSVVRVPVDVTTLATSDTLAENLEISRNRTRIICDSILTENDRPSWMVKAYELLMMRYEEAIKVSSEAGEKPDAIITES